jgi:hypothetical protein
VPCRDILGGSRELGQRPGERSAHKQDEEHRHHESHASGFEKPRRQVPGRRGRDRRLRKRQHDVRNIKLAFESDRDRGGDVALPFQRRPCLADIGDALRGHDRNDGARGVGAPAVVDNCMLAVQKYQPIRIEQRCYRAQSRVEVDGVVKRAVRRDRARRERRVQALLVTHQACRRDDSPVQLILNTLDLQVAHQHPGHGAA